MAHKNATKHQSAWVHKNRQVYNEYMNEYVEKIRNLSDFMNPKPKGLGILYIKSIKKIAYFVIKPFVK